MALQKFIGSEAEGIPLSKKLEIFLDIVFLKYGFKR
jgi:hypothetical protein